MHCSPCCFSLKTGTKFIAVASLVMSLVMICVYASLVVDTANGNEENEDNSTTPEISSTSGPATTTSTTPLATTSITTQTSTTTTQTTTSSTQTTTSTTQATTSTTQATTSTTQATTSTTQATTSTTQATTTSIQTPATTNLKQPKISAVVNEKGSSKEKRSASTEGSESSSVSPEVPDEQLTLIMVYTVAIAIYVVEMVASSVLICGVKKENASLMIIWLIWEGILLVFHMEELVRTSYQHETEGVAHFVQVVIKSYFWIVVMSYRLTVVRARGYQLNGGHKDSYQELQNMESTSERSRD